MNYYKIEVVKEVLRSEYAADHVSAGPRPRTETWRRVAEGHDYRVFLAWEHGEEIVSERELRHAARGLAIAAEPLVDAVKARGGLWLGPSPPGAA
ncbi:MAG TPA: hypothetical protein VFY93_06065 [Planctomycetota bacterium]|nr:hypothetical protein [Planctomycetota bacterium]